MHKVYFKPSSLVFSSWGNVSKSFECSTVHTHSQDPDSKRSNNKTKIGRNNGRGRKIESWVNSWARRAWDSGIFNEVSSMLLPTSCTNFKQHTSYSTNDIVKERRRFEYRLKNRGGQEGFSGLWHYELNLEILKNSERKRWSSETIEERLRGSSSNHSIFTRALKSFRKTFVCASVRRFLYRSVARVVLQDCFQRP